MTRRHRAREGMRFFNEVGSTFFCFHSSAVFFNLINSISFAVLLRFWELGKMTTNHIFIYLFLLSFLQIALVLIDEVHLLSEGRGSCLEAGVVSRIKLVACKPEMAGVRS